MYSVIFSDEAAKELAALDGTADRGRLLAAIERLGVNPHDSGIGEVIDAEGRINRLAVVGSIGVVYWTDDTTQRLRIVAIAEVGAA